MSETKDKVAQALYIAPLKAPGGVSHEDSLRFLAQRESSLAAVSSSHTPHNPSHPVLALAAQAGAADTVQSPASVAELARALRNDLDLIYYHVRNQIEYHPMYGVAKGTVPTLIDGISGPFDQCSVMVDLLRQAGYVANYQLGQIDLSEAEIANWLGTDTSGTSSANISIAHDVLANGGIPCTTYDSGGGVWRIYLTHIWVKVTVGGQDYVFDPSYKNYTYVSGIDLATATGYDQATLLADANIGATIDPSGDWIENVNNSNIRADLNTYASNLISYIRTNNPTATLVDIVGGRRIVEVSTPLRQTVLPYLKSGTTPTDWTSIPDSYRITIRFQYPGFDVTKYGDEIYSKRLTMFFNTSREAEFRLDGTLLATGTAQALNTYNSVQITVTHPYVTTLYNTDGFEQIYAPYNSTDQPYYLIPCLIGPTRKGMQDYHFQKLAANQFAGGGALSEPILGEQLYLVAHAVQNSAFNMLERLAKVQVTMHHSLGVCYLQDYASLGKQLANYGAAQNGIYAVTPLDGNTTDIHRFGQASGMHGYTNEMVAMQQILGTSGASATRVLDVANADGTRIYKGTNSNWSTVVSPNLSLYDIDLSSIPVYLANGYFVLIPKTGDQAYNSINIEGYVLNSTADFGSAIGILGANFGGICWWAGFMPPKDKDCEDPQSPGPGPANLRKGDSGQSQNDLSLGGGYVPLNFHLRYDSSGRLSDGPVGSGWTHGWQTNAGATSDGFKGNLGTESAIDGVAIIVECFVALDLLTDTAPTILKMMTASLANSWLADQVTTNIVEIEFQNEVLSFTKLPDGSYNPPQKNADTLVKNGDGTFTLTSPRGVAHNFNSDGTLGTIVYPQGVTITLTYSGGQLQTISNGMGRTLTLTYSGSHISSVSDGTRSVQYTIDTSNQLTAIEDPLLNSTTFEYDEPGRLWKYFLPENPTIPMVTNTYDSLGRIASQLDMNSRWIARVESSQVTVGGTITPGDIVTVTARVASLPGGQKSVSYTVLMGDSLTSVATGLKDAINGDSTLSDVSVAATSSGPVVSLSSLTPATYVLSTSIAATVSLAATATTGDVITATVFNSALAGGQKSVSYTVLSGDSTDSIAQGIENAVNADSSLAAIGVTASNLNGPELGRVALSSTSANVTTYSGSTSTGATESLYFDAHSTFYIAGPRTEFVNALGRSKIYEFDNQDNLIRKTDELGNVTQFSFDGLRRKTEQILPEGNKTQWTYDAKNNVLTERQIAKVGSGLSDLVRNLTYDPTWNKLATDQDPRGNTTSYTYDATTGSLLTVERPVIGGFTPTVTMTYNSRGQVLTRTDETGIVTKFDYSSTNETLEQITQDFGTGRLNLLTVLGYNDPGDVTSVQDPRGFTTAYVFDANRQLTQRTDPSPFSYVANVVYDKNGNLKHLERQTSDISNPWQMFDMTYNADNQLATLTDPSSNVATRQYNELRLLWKSIDAESRVTEYQYDQRNKLLKAIDPGSVVDQTILYSANGQKSQIADARNNVVQLTQDGFDRPDKTIYPDETFEQNSVYDENGNVLTYLTRSGDSIVNTFDVLNRLATKTPTGQAVVTLTYDLAGRRTKASTPVVTDDPSSGDFLFEFDTAGRFFRETYPDSKQVTFELDNNGNVTKLTHPDGYFVDRVYDKLNRLTDIKLNGSGSYAAHFDFDALSRRTKLTYQNGVVTDYTFELNSDLTSMLHTFSGSHVRFDFDVDRIHRLISQEVSDGHFLLAPSTTSSTAYTADSVNKYSDVGGIAYEYNANGCLTSDGEWAFTFDTENQLLTASNSPIAVTNLYDPLHRQREHKVVDSSGTTKNRYIYSGWRRIEDYGGTDGTTLLQRYVYGDDSLDEPLIQITAVDGTLTYMHADRNGSIIALSDVAGVMTDSYKYSPWGESTDLTGTTFGYTGQRFDLECGLYYYKNRYYSPKLGRFLQPDSITRQLRYKANQSCSCGCRGCMDSDYSADDPNLYAYVDNDPLNFVDPYGRSTLGLAGFAALVLVVIALYLLWLDQERKREERGECRKEPFAPGDIQNNPSGPWTSIRPPTANDPGAFINPKGEIRPGSGVTDGTNQLDRDDRSWFDNMGQMHNIDPRGNEWITAPIKYPENDPLRHLPSVPHALWGTEISADPA